ncbi:glycosyltransferase [Chelativorans sp. ZYF759]|uniref:glycosyltransferase n=1 Tax=Chelativorans sp. ZYF759 TaxID=2692213 RepID=UPI00145DEF25|nr:glycosyltransferase [Chelativorans sp. ZYF759]NMG41092.1 glycosyltransferase [Chelativorans sp. ZYF759]
MLSVVIQTHNDEDSLARTLASLVSASVEGVVREVIVCDGGSTDRTHLVADHTGCQFIAGGLSAGIGKARSDWLLFLKPGTRLADGWMAEVVDHIARGRGPARFTRSRGSRPPILSRLFFLPRSRFDGLVIEKARAQALARGNEDAAWLARKVSARRLAGEIHLPA